NSYRFVRFLYHLNPDVIISTHFYSSEVIAYQRRIKKYNGRLISVITDFKVHFFWVVKGIDKFVVAFQSTKRELIRKGIEEERVNVLGIPIDAVFAESQNKDLLLERLKLQKNLFTVLIVSGGSGVGPIEKLADELENLPYPVQLIIVCGHNEFLYNRLSSKKFKVPAKIYGFSRNMHELMNISDIIITKSGGLTSSECLASNLPMIIIAPVPG
ncbi:MAG: glycosyltransferase, partial [Candidatus Omnitrophota bacterium]|nr:glycosyltransferase [Candidatus Omnitrophota bacterium]